MKAAESKRQELIQMCRKLIRCEKRKCNKYKHQMSEASLIEGSDVSDMIELFYLLPTMKKIRYYQSLLKHLENVNFYE